MRFLLYHEKEKGKKRTAVKTKEEVLEYSINLIKNNIEKNIISLIAPNQDLVKKIHELNIPFARVFADINLNNIIRIRLKKRGNTDEFVDEMCNIETVANFYKEDIEDKKADFKIIFDNDEYISDIFKTK